MALDLTFQVCPTHARACVRGEGSIGEFYVALHHAAERTSHTNGLLLLDLRELRGLGKMTEQIMAGMEAAREFRPTCRVAVIEPASRVTRNGERAARRLGLDLRVFAVEDEPQAIAWLLEKAKPDR